MKAVIVYESMYGNTHLIAEEIAVGLRTAGEVAVVPVAGATADVLAGADVVVAGGPTHVHGMSRDSTRTSAATAAHKPNSDLALDPDAEGLGLREWFDGIGHFSGAAAAFDTRMPGPEILTGRASKGISRELRRHGFVEVADPTSFLVSRQNHLEPGEKDHARRWGEQLAAAMAAR